LGDPGIDGRIILRCIFSKWDVGVWTGLSWLRIGTGGGQLIHMSEHKQMFNQYNKPFLIQMSGNLD
jgi:hypothetical protein